MRYHSVGMVLGLGLASYTMKCSSSEKGNMRVIEFTCHVSDGLKPGVGMCIL